MGIPLKLVWEQFAIVAMLGWGLVGGLWVTELEP
jgi:hypothetical protein